jgi:hypothetical protein
MTNNTGDVIHISPELVKVLAGAILAALLGIAGYMAVWALNDMGFKREVILRLNNLDKAIEEIKRQTDVVPRNTQKIDDLTNRVRRLEKDDG